MKAPATYYLTEKQKYLVLYDVMHEFKNGVVTSKIESVMLYDVIDGHFLKMKVELFHQMVIDKQLQLIVEAKRKAP